MIIEGQLPVANSPPLQRSVPSTWTARLKSELGETPLAFTNRESTRSATEGAQTTGEVARASESADLFIGSGRAT